MKSKTNKDNGMQSIATSLKQIVALLEYQISYQQGGGQVSASKLLKQQQQQKKPRRVK